MASNTEKNSESSDSPIATPVAKQPTLEVVETKSERIKATRHPRWTRQETLVLIEAKKMVENGEQLFRFKSSYGLLNNSDPKWEIVSSCCQQQGVKRGSVQCRKRWGNLLTDFRKIKKWESSVKDEGESFWMMRNDKRKENKLPGFFDEVVYRVLDGGVLSAVALPLTLIKMPSKPENGVGHVEGMALEHDDNDDDDDDNEEDEAIVDSDKMSWSTEENIFDTNTARSKLFSPIKTSASKGTFLRGSLKITPTLALPTTEKQQHPSCQGNYYPGCHREPMFQEGHKRKRSSPDNSEDATDFSNNIIKVLRRNTNIMKAYLGAQNINQQLARDQQKEQSDNLVAALGKLTDAMTKIADKL
ncbi:PREDICTED: trihelix transcription factor ASR3-like [Lupinus angustifolius]|uniref:trihelix transcription factor ASR3-like n=1 Tax=Lupinus angustifolius TaxID=3871 RepID=UPI00092EC08A|nr:PREDICTED: trihelix transcription factor ASR3-like [Lupinus angustifolius]